MPNWLLFILPSFIWGTTWLTIKFQHGVVPPEASVVYRFGLASLLLFGWCHLRGVRLAFDARTHASFAFLGLLQYALNYVLVYLSEQRLTSGLVAVLFALMVAWNLTGARLFFRSRLSAPLVAGAAIGIAGVTLVFWPEVSHVSGARRELEGAGLAVLATLVSSAGNLWSQRVYARDVGIAPSTAWSMLYATGMVFLYCVARGVPFRFEASVPYVASLVYLAVFGSVFAFVTFLTLLRRVGAGVAGYTSALIPVLAMLTSTVFEGYRWSAVALAGMLLVLAGNVMVMRAKG